MKKALILLLLCFSFCCDAQKNFFAEKINTVFIPIGESNSGGLAAISQLSNPSEAGPRPSVKIFNNVSHRFEDLNIGVNNMLGHTGLSAYVNSAFGFELEIANRAARSAIDRPFYFNPCYVLKAGQGGSLISEWNAGGAYMDTFALRFSQAKALIPNPNFRIVFLYSQGINDAIAGTDVNTWKAATIAHFADLRQIVGDPDAVIIMTQFQGMSNSPGSPANYDNYSAAIASIAATQHRVYSVNTSGSTFSTTLVGGANHWDGTDTGIKLVTGRMLDIVENIW